MPKRYKLIMSDVEAMQLTPERIKDAALWSGGKEAEEIDPFDASRRFVALNLPTLAGVQRASQGDYIVRDAKGFWSVIPCHEFESKYRLAE